MDRTQLDKLVAEVRRRYYDDKSVHFMTHLCNVAHSYWLDNPYDRAESVVRSMLVDEFARIKRDSKLPKCGVCGRRAYTEREEHNVCMECAAKADSRSIKAQKTIQLELFN